VKRQCDRHYGTASHDPLQRLLDGEEHASGIDVERLVDVLRRGVGQQRVLFFEQLTVALGDKTRTLFNGSGPTAPGRQPPLPI